MWQTPLAFETFRHLIRMQIRRRAAFLPSSAKLPRNPFGFSGEEEQIDLFDYWRYTVCLL